VSKMAAMLSDERYEAILRRGSECEMLAQVARDMSTRKKCAELAVEYRVLATRLKQLELIEEVLMCTTMSSQATISHTPLRRRILAS